jgi:hypothetical protein
MENCKYLTAASCVRVNEVLLAATDYGLDRFIVMSVVMCQ